MSQDILHLNNLSYSTPESLLCSKKTTRARYPIYSERYEDCIGGEVLQIPFENIPDCCYIDGSKSSISLKINVNIPNPTAEDDVFFWATEINDFAGDYANTGATIVNLIKSAIHQLDNNEILYRENFLNMMQTIREYSQSFERKRVLTEVGGYVISETKYNQYGVNKNTSFNIPLFLLSPFWNTASLIPSKILKNSKLSLVVNKIKESLVAYNRASNRVSFPDDVSVTFSEMSLNLYQTELYDQLDKSIKNQIIHFPYYSNNNDIHLLTSSSFMINIPLQASNLAYVALKFRAGGDSPIESASIQDLGDVKTQDNNYLPIKIQARINGMIFPNFPINDSAQAYIESIKALQTISYPNAQNVDEMKVENKLMGSTISYFQFSHTEVTEIADNNIQLVSGFSSGGVIFAIDLQKSNNVSLTGLEVNASRNLTIEIEGLDNYDNLTLFSQVRYMNVATIDKDKIVIMK